MQKLYRIAARVCQSLVPSEAAQRQITRRYTGLYNIKGG